MSGRAVIKDRQFKSTNSGKVSAGDNPGKTKVRNRVHESQSAVITDRIRNKYSDAAVSHPLQTCQMASDCQSIATSVCDVDGLTLQCDDIQVSAQLPRSLRPGSYQAPHPPKEKQKKSLTRAYDIILEVAATPVVDGQAGGAGDQAKTAVLEVAAKPIEDGGHKVEPKKVTISYDHVGEACPQIRHSAAILSPRGMEAHDSPQTPDMCAGPVDIKAFGPALPMDSKAGRCTYLDMIRFFTAKASPKRIEVTAEGCGRREDDQPVKRKIKGLVIVHREETWGLKFKIPKTGIEYGRENFKRIGKKREKHQTVDTKTNVYRRGEGKSRYGYAKTVTEKRSWYGSQKIEQRTGKDKKKFKEFDSNFQLERNGTPLGIGDLISNLIRLKRFIDDTQSLIEDFSEFVPKAGFFMDWELEFLIGYLSANWGHRPGVKYCDQHYHWLEKYGEISIDLVVLKGELEVAFGIEAVSPDILNWFGGKLYELVLKASCELKADITISGTFDLFGPDGRTQKKIGNSGTEKVLNSITGTVVPDVYIQATVTAFGVGVDARAGCEWGFEAQASLVMPLNVRAKIERRELQLYAYWTHAKRKPSQRWDKTLMEKDKLEKYFLS
jgi:hypothetical protein